MGFRAFVVADRESGNTDVHLQAHRGDGVVDVGLPPTETWFPLMRAATTTALFIPPGTTEVGTEVHDWVVSVEATDLWKASLELFDL